MATREPLQSINDRNDRNLFFWTPMVAFTAVMAVLGVTEIHSLIDFNNHIAMYALGGLLIVLLNAGRTWSRRRASRF